MEALIAGNGHMTSQPRHIFYIGVYDSEFYWDCRVITNRIVRHISFTLDSKNVSTINKSYNIKVESLKTIGTYMHSLTRVMW